MRWKLESEESLTDHGLTRIYMLHVGTLYLERKVTEKEIVASSSGGLWVQAEKRWAEALRLLASADRLVAEAGPFTRPQASKRAVMLRQSAYGLQRTTLMAIFPEAADLLRKARP